MGAPFYTVSGPGVDKKAPTFRAAITRAENACFRMPEGTSFNVRENGDKGIYRVEVTADRGCVGVWV